MNDLIKAQLDHIIQCYKQMDDIFHIYAMERGLSDSAFWILYALCEAERPYTQNNICEEWHYTKQTVHSAVASLTKAGYVVLEHIPNSRNSKSILLTEQGRAYVNTHIQSLLETEQSAFGQLSDEERNQYCALVKKHLSLFSEAVTALKKSAASGEGP